MSIRRTALTLLPQARLLLAMLVVATFANNTQAEPINWRHNLDAAKVEAGRTGKLILLHFYTSSCGPCKKLERDVFSQPQIAAAMEQGFIPVKLNADQSPALANAYQITRVPTEVVLNWQGSIVQKLSCPLEPNAYGAQLMNVAQHYQQRSANRTASAQVPIHSAYAGLKIGQSKNNQPNVAAAPVNNAPTGPVVTNNPYVNAAPPVRPASPAAVVQQPSLNTPANQGANRYGNRYATAATPAPVAAVQPAAKPPVAQATATPKVVANRSAASAPLVAKSATQAPAPVMSAAITPTPQQAIAPPAIVKTATPTATPAAPAIATAAPIVADVWPPKLPVGTPPLAFDGYCPVSLQKAQKWVRGDKAFGAIHRGRTYIFASNEQRQKFLTAPDSYSPVFSGNDPVLLLDENKEEAGSRKFGFAYRGAFYLFSSQQTMERFAAQPDRYSAGVRQAMNRMDAAAGGTIRR